MLSWVSLPFHYLLDKLEAVLPSNLLQQLSRIWIKINWRKYEDFSFMNVRRKWSKGRNTRECIWHTNREWILKSYSQWYLPLHCQWYYWLAVYAEELWATLPMANGNPHSCTSSRARTLICAVITKYFWVMYLMLKSRFINQVCWNWIYGFARLRFVWLRSTLHAKTLFIV